MKILGLEANNPFSLFLILILLIAASGGFDPEEKTVTPQEEGPAQAFRAGDRWRQRRRFGRDRARSFPRTLPLAR